MIVNVSKNDHQSIVIKFLHIRQIIVTIRQNHCQYKSNDGHYYHNISSRAPNLADNEKVKEFNV